MNYISTLILIVFSTFVFSDDIRHLHNDQNRIDRANIYNELLGNDFTSHSSKTEQIIELVMSNPVIIDRIIYEVKDLPTKVRFFSSTEIKFEDFMNILTKTYNFSPIYNNVSKSTLEKKIIINDKYNTLIEVLGYLESVTNTKITVWPKGTGASIMVTGLL